MTQQELDLRFTYHEAEQSAQVAAWEDIRARARSFAERILEWAPECREQSLAITKLEEVVMWANAAVARRGTGENAPGAANEG